MRMRALLAELVPRAEVLAGSAEAIPLDDASVDGAFVAEAFHWFDLRANGGSRSQPRRSRTWWSIASTSSTSPTAKA